MPLDLRQRLLKEGYSFNFFQAVRLLEKLEGEDYSIGRGDYYEPVRFITDNSVAFPSGEITKVEEQSRHELKVMYLCFMGLYGVSSPLPTYFTDPITIKKEEYFPLKKFLDIFGHRIYSLYYRAWKKYRHEFNFRGDKADAYSNAVYCLSGQKTRLRSADGRTIENEFKKIFYSGFFGRRVRSAENLKNLVRGFFDLEQVRIRQFVSRWIDNPAKTILGNPATKLGLGPHLGTRIKDRSGHFVIEIGPVPYHTFIKFSAWAGSSREPGGSRGPGGQRRPVTLGEKIRGLALDFLRDPLSFGIEVILDTEGEKQPLLGASKALLGWGTRLAGEHAEPVRISV